MPEWVPVSRLGEIDLVDDDRLLPHLLMEDGVVFGHQRLGADGALEAFTLE